MQTLTAVLHNRFQTCEKFLAKITLKLLQICAIISEVSCSVHVAVHASF